MSNALISNYDELSSFAKQFRDEGEDIVQLHSTMRQRILLLQKEWSGKAADGFYEEMASELLPALQRISSALFFSNEVLIKIMKIMHSADEETVAYFTKDLYSDFGLGGFQNSLVDDPVVVDPAVVDSPLDIPPAPEAEKLKPDETPENQIKEGGATGGGEVDENSRGIKGDLKGMGMGVSDQPAPAKIAEQSGGVSQVTPENIHNITENVESQTTKTPDAAENLKSNPDSSPNNASAAGAGIAGIAGAAAMGGVANKFAKGQDKSS